MCKILCKVWQKKTQFTDFWNWCFKRRYWHFHFSSSNRSSSHVETVSNNWFNKLMFNGIAEAPEEVDPEKRRQNLRNYLFDLDVDMNWDEYAPTVVEKVKRLQFVMEKKRKERKGTNSKGQPCRSFPRKGENYCKNYKPVCSPFFLHFHKLKQIYSKKNQKWMRAEVLV